MKNIITLLFLSIISFGYSQSGIGVNAQQNKEVLSFPTSPDAYSFDKVGKLPMDLFNGKANLSVPIYDIRTENLIFPIRLSYNTGGIKQNEISSSVGLGWSLSIPNTIAKNIIGKDDDFFPIYFKDYNIAYQHTSIDPWNDNVKKETLGYLYEGVYDVLPDLFSYNLPSVNGNFILNNNIGYTIPHNDIKIQRLGNNGGFKVIDTHGNQFWFSGKNSVMSKRSQTVPQISTNSYLLDSLRTVKKGLIKFEYQRTLTYSEQSKFESRILTSGQAPVGYTPFPPLQTSPAPRMDTSNNSEKLITKIIFPDGEINFRYSGDDNLNTFGNEVYRKDINSQNGAALRRVIVRNKAGNIIKDISLNYSYFESDSSNKTYEDYRLKLTEVRDNLKNNKYSFAYNENNPLPSRNSNNDDYWGYFNSLSNTKSGTSIPDQVSSSSIGLGESIISGGRSRRTYSPYAQLGILKSIKYPTGASKNLYYESNTIESTQSSMVEDIEHYKSFGNSYDSLALPKPSRDTILNVPSSAFINKIAPKFRARFGNGCANNNDDIGQIRETRCKGDVTVDGQGYSSNGKPYTVEFGATTSPIKFRLFRIGDCGCSLSLDIKSLRQISTTNTENVGGLRISKIEDVDENNTSNIFNYRYERYTPATGGYKGSGKLKHSFQFVKPFYRVAHPNSENAAAADYIQKNLMIQNSGNAYNSYNSSNIVTYSSVIEYNDLGETIYEFDDGNSGANNISSNKSIPYDDWKFGSPLRTTYKKGSNILKEEIFEYDLDSLKNKLSGYNNITDDQIAFGLDLNIVPYNVENFNSPPLSSYQVDMNAVEIYGGKIEMKKSKVIEYFQGNQKLETQSDYTYYNTDINKPINLKSVSSVLFSGENNLTTYLYAHDKNNQKLIDANMIGIPLETTVVEKQNATTAGKMTSKSETKYDDPANLFPSSVVSYDIQNNNTSTTEVTYNKYDAKGNIQQYTTKDRVPTVIVWGYNGTQPIAKVQGATYDQLVSLGLITTIVNASDSDAANPANEPALITALDTFRKNSGLSAYQITTYTYDPLIGVTSITPPSGIREVYIYDTANRLKEIRQDSKTGNLIKEFKYNYKQ